MVQELSPTAERIAARLAPTLGPNTARVAVVTVARKRLGREPRTIGPMDVPALVEGLRPMLNTLIGAQAAEALTRAIAQEANP